MYLLYLFTPTLFQFFLESLERPPPPGQGLVHGVAAQQHQRCQAVHRPLNRQLAPLCCRPQAARLSCGVSAAVPEIMDINWESSVEGVVLFEDI